MNVYPAFIYLNLLESKINMNCMYRQGRIKLFGAPRQWKISAPYFKQCFFRGGGGLYYPPDWVKHHASQSQDRNNKYFILYIEFCINNKI
jgi:hypothetical protein